MQKTRAYLAGKALGKAIVGLGHLMYQEETTYKLFCGLEKVIYAEQKRREKIVFDSGRMKKPEKKVSKK